MLDKSAPEFAVGNKLAVRSPYNVRYRSAATAGSVSFYCAGADISHGRLRVRRTLSRLS
jgi:hypothetical protein